MGVSVTRPIPSVAKGSIAKAWPSFNFVVSWLFMLGIDKPACKFHFSKLWPVKLVIGFNLYSWIASSTACPISPISTPARTVLMAASKPAADAYIIS